MISAKFLLFFYPLPLLPAFGSDLLYKIHATSLLYVRFSMTRLPPPMRTSYLEAPLLSSERKSRAHPAHATSGKSASRETHRKEGGKGLGGGTRAILSTFRLYEPPRNFDRGKRAGKSAFSNQSWNSSPTPANLFVGKESENVWRMCSDLFIKL